MEEQIKLLCGGDSRLGFTAQNGGEVYFFPPDGTFL